MVCVEILVQSELEDRGRALSGDDGRVGEEEHPNTIPPEDGQFETHNREKRTNFSPYFSTTFSRLLTQFKYHFHNVAE